MNRIFPFILSLIISLSLWAQADRSELWQAFDAKDFEKVASLIRAGADLKDKGSLGAAPLHEAVRLNHLPTVELLLEHGAEIDPSDGFDWTPALIAASEGYLDILKLLVDHGADVTVADKEGINGFMWAAVNGHVDVLVFLKDQGIDIQARDRRGRNAWDFVKMSDHSSVSEVQDVLREFGVGKGDLTHAESMQKLKGVSVVNEAQRLQKLAECDAVRSLLGRTDLGESAGSIYGILAVCLAQKADFSGAESALSSAAEHDAPAKDLSRSHVYVSNYYRKHAAQMRDKDLLKYAALNLEKAIGFDDGNRPSLHYHLASVYKELNRFEEAWRHYKIFLEKPNDEKMAAKARDAMAIVKARATGSVDQIPIRDLNGNQLDFTQYKGKALLIDFWATWCKPCVKSLPLLRKLHKKTAKSPLAVISISVDRDLDQLKAFIKENDMQWPQFSDPNNMTSRQLFSVSSFPTYILIDHEGKAVYRSKGYSPGKEAELWSQVNKAVRKAKRAAKK